MFSQGKPGVSGFPQIFSRSCMAATSILRSAARASALARSSQGNSQASPQLEDSLRGTGAMRAPIPASLQDRSNKSAMLVVLNVARQLNETTPPFSKKRLSSRLSPLRISLLRGPELAIFLESRQDYTLRPTFRNGLIFRPERQKGRRTYIMKNSCRGREARGKTRLPAGGPLDGGGHVFRTGTRETEGGEPHFRFAGTAALPNDKREADSCFFS